MSARNRIWAGAALLAASTIATNAGACDLERNEFGFWIGECRLKEHFKDLELVVTLEHSRPPYVVPLPNLRIDKFKFESNFGTTEFFVFADVANNGTRDSAATRVAVMLNQIDPITGQTIGGTQPLEAKVPPLARGTVQRIYLGATNVPNRAQDWDLHVVAVVDPPTTSQPSFGAVWEGDESDNTRQEHCRVYGPVPDLSVGACD